MIDQFTAMGLAEYASKPGTRTLDWTIFSDLPVHDKTAMARSQSCLNSFRQMVEQRGSILKFLRSFRRVDCTAPNENASVSNSMVN